MYTRGGGCGEVYSRGGGKGCSEEESEACRFFVLAEQHAKKKFEGCSFSLAIDQLVGDEFVKVYFDCVATNQVDTVDVRFFLCFSAVFFVARHKSFVWRLFFCRFCCDDVVVVAVGFGGGTMPQRCRNRCQYVSPSLDF